MQKFKFDNRKKFTHIRKKKKQKSLAIQFLKCRRCVVYYFNCYDVSLRFLLFFWYFVQCLQKKETNQKFYAYKCTTSVWYWTVNVHRKTTNSGLFFFFFAKEIKLYTKIAENDEKEEEEEKEWKRDDKPSSWKTRNKTNRRSSKYVHLYTTAKATKNFERHILFVVRFFYIRCHRCHHHRQLLLLLLLLLLLFRWPQLAATAITSVNAVVFI